MFTKIDLAISPQEDKSCLLCSPVLHLHNLWGLNHFKYQWLSNFSLCFSTNRDPCCLSVWSSETPVLFLWFPTGLLVGLTELCPPSSWVGCQVPWMCFQDISGSAHYFSSPSWPPLQCGASRVFLFIICSFHRGFPKMKFALVPRACCVLAKLTTVTKSLGDALPRLSSHRFPCLPWYFYVLNS